MSRFAVGCFLIILVAIGTSSATLARQEKPGTQEKVYLLRGLTNVLSPGIDQLANDLHQKNIGTTVRSQSFILEFPGCRGNSGLQERERQFNCAGRPLAWRERGP